MVEEKDKQYPDAMFVLWNFNLRGNQGSYYLESMKYNWTSGEMTVDKFACLVNEKKQSYYLQIVRPRKSSSGDK
jgi:hypothetical protein